MHAERDQDYWESLAVRRWRRVKWRQTGEGPPEGVCDAYGTPLHRPGTYYLRPVYTDGAVWLCQRAYEEMVRRTRGVRPSRRYRREGGRDEAS